MSKQFFEKKVHKKSWKLLFHDCYQVNLKSPSYNLSSDITHVFSPLVVPGACPGPSLYSSNGLAGQSISSVCCIIHRLSSSVHGDYLLPSEEPVLFALYSLLLERKSLLLVMRLSYFLVPVAIGFQEPSCIELWRQPCQYAIHRARRLHGSRHAQLSTKFASLSNGKKENLGGIHVLSDWADDNDGTCNHGKEVNVLGQHRQRCEGLLMRL